eukprot:88814_1
MGAVALPNVFALGDCGVNNMSPCAPTAQAAAQQAKWLAAALNSANGEPNGHHHSHEFRYNHLGTMVNIGHKSALFDKDGFELKGLYSWIFWKSAYLTQLMSWKNRISVAAHWLKAYTIGRDVTLF